MRDGTPWRFACVGALNTLCGLGLILWLREGLGWSDAAANLAGYAPLMALSFAMHRQWTFRHRGRVVPGLGRYVLVLAAAYLANLATVGLLLAAATPTAWAHALGVAPYVLVNYLGARHFAFASPPAAVSGPSPSSPPPRSRRPAAPAAARHRP